MLDVQDGVAVVAVVVGVAAGAASVSVDEVAPGGASGGGVWVVAELYLDAVAVAPLGVEPPVVAV